MILRRTDEVRKHEVKSAFLNGEEKPVQGRVDIQWLIHNAVGGEEYRHRFALRCFTMDPGAVIPEHNHGYVQAVFVLKGELEIWSGGNVIIGKPGDVVYFGESEPHGLKNVSPETASFLCIIDCPGEETCLAPAEEEGAGAGC